MKPGRRFGVRTAYMNRKIIAIGGGRMPRTQEIDREVVRLAGKRSPVCLFIPTASMDDPGYCARVERQYRGLLGCRFKTLLLYRDRPSASEIRDTILNSDIIYVGGGNTLRMMKLWRRLGVDHYLDRARRNGTVLSGSSAGALCWFREGNSDSRSYSDASDMTLIKVTGLHFVDALVCPHYDVERHRQPGLRAMMKKTAGVAIALDNCSAIEIVDDEYRILTSARRKHAYKIFWHKSRYYRIPLRKDGQFRKLAPLLKRGIEE